MFKVINFVYVLIVLLALGGLVGYQTMEYVLEYWTEAEITFSLWAFLAGMLGSEIWVPAAIVTFLLSRVL